MYDFHCGFHHPLNVADLDRKTAFDSVDHHALWKALRGQGTQYIILDLIIALHDNTGAQIQIGK